MRYITFTKGRYTSICPYQAGYDLESYVTRDLQRENVTRDLPFPSVAELKQRIDTNGGCLLTKVNGRVSKYSVDKVGGSPDFYACEDYAAIIYESTKTSIFYIEGNTNAQREVAINNMIQILPDHCYQSSVNRMAGSEAISYSYVDGGLLQIIDTERLFSGINAEAYLYEGSKLVGVYHPKGQSLPWMKFPDGANVAHAIIDSFAGNAEYDSIISTTGTKDFSIYNNAASIKELNDTIYKGLFTDVGIVKSMSKLFKKKAYKCIKKDVLCARESLVGKMVPLMAGFDTTTQEVVVALSPERVRDLVDSNFRGHYFYKSTNLDLVVESLMSQIERAKNEFDDAFKDRINSFLATSLPLYTGQYKYEDSDSFEGNTVVALPTISKSANISQFTHAGDFDLKDEGCDLQFGSKCQNHISAQNLDIADDIKTQINASLAFFKSNVIARLDGLRASSSIFGDVKVFDNLNGEASASVSGIRARNTFDGISARSFVELTFDVDVGEKILPPVLLSETDDDNSMGCNHIKKAVEAAFSGDGFRNVVVSVSYEPMEREGFRVIEKCWKHRTGWDDLRYTRFQSVALAILTLGITSACGINDYYWVKHDPQLLWDEDVKYMPAPLYKVRVKFETEGVFTNHFQSTNDAIQERYDESLTDAIANAVNLVIEGEISDIEVSGSKCFVKIEKDGEVIDSKNTVPTGLCVSNLGVSLDAVKSMCLRYQDILSTLSRDENIDTSLQQSNLSRVLQWLENSTGYDTAQFKDVKVLDNLAFERALNSLDNETAMIINAYF